MGNVPNHFQITRIAPNNRVLLRRGVGRLAQCTKTLRRIQRHPDPLGNVLRLKEINQQPILAILDHLAHRRGIRTNNQTPAGHGFQ
ncbi:hypothetical protein D3C84_1137970 [compost metagenome]